jgi:hypothetical protein
MPARIQGLILGLGKAKQSNISTASASFLRFTKLDTNVTSTGLTTETDKDEIGKGNEFISAGGVFPVSFMPKNSLNKYASAEFVIWTTAYGLGSVVEAAGAYTINPIDIGTTLELPYFSVVEQVAEGGGSAIDNMFIGCALKRWRYEFNSGPGRQSSKMTAEWEGSGLLTSPSGVTIPGITAEHNMLGASMALTINGTDYVANKRILSGFIDWDNALLPNSRFFPGAGTQSGAAVAGRLETGSRVPRFEFTTRLVSGSPEYAALIAQTTGTAVLTVAFDATHTVTFTFASISYEVVENNQTEGIVSCRVVVAPKWSGTAVLTVTGKCGVVGIAQ